MDGVVVRPRVGLRVLLRFRGMACQREARSRESPAISGDHHFERCCIPRTRAAHATHEKKTHTTAATHVPIPLVGTVHGIPHHPRTRAIVRFVRAVRESRDDRILSRLLQRGRESHCIFTLTMYYISDDNLETEES